MLDDNDWLSYLQFINILLYTLEHQIRTQLTSYTYNLYKRYTQILFNVDSQRFEFVLWQIALDLLSLTHFCAFESEKKQTSAAALNTLTPQ